MAYVGDYSGVLAHVSHDVPPEAYGNVHKGKRHLAVAVLLKVSIFTIWLQALVHDHAVAGLCSQ